MPLSVGTRLGPYEITAPLGAGGMGEVYRARDIRLGRDVALKVLPAEVADDPSRRQRFEVEARAVAALNHPNNVNPSTPGALPTVPRWEQTGDRWAARVLNRRVCDAGRALAL